MASDLIKSLLVAKLAELRAAQPHSDFRLSKSGDSIARFGPYHEDSTDDSGVMLFSAMLGKDDQIVSTTTTAGGQTWGVRVAAKGYEGFPDPPRTECRFGLADIVKTDRGEGAEGIVVRVSSRQGADREWRHRVTVDLDIDGDGTNRVEGDEGVFTLVRAVVPRLA